MMSLLYALAALSAAQAAPDCRNPVTQADMNRCAALEFAASDAQLNAAWPGVLAYARAQDQANRTTDNRQGAAARLLQAQRAWITFRDAHCTVESYQARGGSMEPLLYNTCRAHLTRQRVAQLHALQVE
ncbi:MAG: DUF1311 domain-containing protein [Sphingomonas sp.]|nr:DUF1311 domain-containing protein [Sphingomonas sp.]